MFEDLRNSDDSSGSFTPEEADHEIDDLFKKKEARPALGFKINSRTFLGMTAPQRFVISMLLFSMVCVLGAMLLLITGSIELPF